MIRQNPSIKPGDVYGVEVDAKRGVAAAEHLAGSKVLHPADFLSTQTSAASFSLIHCNPPYDDEIGGGKRYEYAFLSKAADLLAIGGVIALAVPQRVAEGHDVVSFLSQWFEDVSWFPYPSADRKYGEVVVLARRRGEPKEDKEYTLAALCRGSRCGNGVPYPLPRAIGPRLHKKVGFTEDEMVEALAASKLQAAFAPAKPAPVPRPGLQLNEGQRALVLAGGFLDGVIKKDGYAPLVVKALPFKEEYRQTPVVDENEETGTTKTTTVIGERILLSVRALRTDGKILTLKQE